MPNKNRKLFSLQMLLFELRNVTGNPYVHVFGIGMPVLMSFVIIRAFSSEITDLEILANVSTSVFLGIGALMPMAIILMGYASTRAQEMEKGIPERMELFGISQFITLCNRAVAEVIFMLAAFALYFLYGYLVLTLKAPVISGAFIYFLCILLLSIILFCIAHSIASLLKKFGPVYLVTMMLYFFFMIFSGMMGLSYENMPEAMQAVAKLLPTTYINRDFYTIWTGESYRYASLLQSYLFWAAIAGILLLASQKKKPGRSLTAVPLQKYHK